VTGALSAVLLLMPSQLLALAPVPLLIGGLRYGGDVGRQASGVGFGAVVTVTAFLGAGGGTIPGIAGHGLFVAGLGYLGLAALPALLLAWSVEHTRNGSGALTLSVLGYLMVLGGLALTVELFSASGLVGLADQVVVGLLDVQRAFWAGGAERNPELLPLVAALDAARESRRAIGILAFPSLVCSAAVLWLWLNLVYSRWFVASRGVDDDLTAWRMPDMALYLLIGCMAGLVLQVEPIGAFFPPVEPLKVGALNGLVLLGALYWLQGVAVVNWYFFRAGLGPIARMVGLAAQVVLMMNVGTTVLFVLLGLSDAWFNLRRFSKKTSEE